MIHDVYILNGHKLALSYYHKLKTALANNSISCQRLFCISGNTQDQAHCELAAKNIIAATPSDFLINCALGGQHWNENDIIIPDHTAKHILLMAFMDLARAVLPNARVGLQPMHLGLKTPFLHKSENDALWAVSHATWMCPPDCNEPDICPHIQNTRSWDFFESMKKMSLSPIANRQSPETPLFCRYGCTPILREISHLPLNTIVSDLQDFATRLRKGERPKVIVATHSHCHGIVGQFGIH